MYGCMELHGSSHDPCMDAWSQQGRRAVERQLGVVVEGNVAVPADVVAGGERAEERGHAWVRDRPISFTHSDVLGRRRDR